MKIDLSKYDDPEIIKKDGKLQVYDKLKGIYRVVSPNKHSEEYVRQKIIEYLKYELNINYEAIDIEESEAHYHDNNQRMDLLISGISDKKELLMVVECKAETVELTEDVYDQAKGYAERLNIPVLMVTNGLDADFLKRDENNNYEQILNPPTYEELLNYSNIKTEPIKEYSYNRYSYDELFDENIQDEEINKDFDDKTKAIHYDTKTELIPYILNFRDCILDTSHKIDNLSLGKYKFIEDLGVFYRKVNNTGGKFVGNYRSLLVEINGNNEIIDLKVTPYFTDNGNPDTVMMIALNGSQIQWIRFDRFALLDGTTLKFYDDGATSTRNMGPMKKDIILDYIKENSNLEIKDNMVELGQINMSDLIYVDNPEFKNLLSNCIEYALLKQERREIYQDNYIPKNKENENLPEGINQKHIQKIIKNMNIKELEDDSIEYLCNYLNTTALNLSENAIDEAKKANHKNITRFDMLRSINNNMGDNMDNNLIFDDEVEKESVMIFGQKYDSLLDFMNNESIQIPLNVFFDEDHIENASKYDFEGSYIFELEYSPSDKVEYFFVCSDIFEEENVEYLELIPIILPDTNIFRVLDENDEFYIPFNSYYTPLDLEKFQNRENELMDYYANFRPIEDDEIYVTENNINYLVIEENKNNLTVLKKYLEYLQILNEMENDEYKGVYYEEYVYNTGERDIEEYYIENVDDEKIYLEKNDDIKRSRFRIPSYVEFYDENEISYMIVKRLLYAGYISSDELD